MYCGNITTCLNHYSNVYTHVLQKMLNDPQPSLYGSAIYWLTRSTSRQVRSYAEAKATSTQTIYAALSCACLFEPQLLTLSLLSTLALVGSIFNLHAANFLQVWRHYLEKI